MIDLNTPLSAMASLEWWTPSKVFGAVAFVIFIVWLVIPSRYH